jgi:hypothetical protein
VKGLSVFVFVDEVISDEGIIKKIGEQVKCFGIGILL